MERIEIYRDDKIKVEINKRANDFLDFMNVEVVELEQSIFHILVEDVLQIIDEAGWEQENCEILCCPSIPIIKKKQRICLNSYFEIFQHIIDYFVMTEDNEDIEESKKILEDFYRDINVPFIIQLYPKNLYPINIVAVAKVDNIILIGFFKRREEK